MRSLRSGRTDPFLLAALPIAHRGLHGGGRVENSRSAFEAALAAGHGIELDVQASRDGEAIVFHDARLERLTDEQGEVAARSAAELARITLLNSGDTIPSLPQVLHWIGGRVPVLVEIKAPRHGANVLAAAVHRAVAAYEGPIGVMSFNPRIPGWFARAAPHVLRGLVVTEQGRRGLHRALARRLSIAWASADFLAYDVRDLPSATAAAFRGRGKPVLTWTVRSEADRAGAAVHADQIIHELPVHG